MYLILFINYILKIVYFNAIRLSMTSYKNNRLNNLLNEWLPGTVILSSWLQKQGYSTSLLAQYRKNSWIASLGYGANIRPKDRVDWTGGLFALQEQAGLPVHVGGKSALQLQGYAHFLPLGGNTIVTLFGSSGIKPPGWFLKHSWDVKIYYAMSGIFSKQDIGLTRKNMGAYSIKISAPERAILEVLHLIPREESYEEAKLLMEGLSTLRPKLIQQLLENCSSVKVKRLFMHLAEKCNHDWVKEVLKEKIDFGKGKRMIVRGGHLDPKYNISVP